MQFHKIDIGHIVMSKQLS